MAITPKKILLVEDDTFLAMVIKTRLAREGFEVLLAADGESVLPIVKKEKPAILLLDIILPGKSGFEIMEELETAKIKPAFMVISNLGQNEDLERAQKHGSLAYFVKSKVNLDEIAEKLKTFFESEGGKGK